LCHFFCGNNRANEFGCGAKFKVIGEWLGSCQAALVIQLFDDAIISGNDADIGIHHEELLLVDLLLCAFVFSTVLDKR